GRLQENTGWDRIARDMLTVEGEYRTDQPEKNGAAFFLLSRAGADAPTERAAEASRFLLGIQIQCAQCHDHPYDRWKREQFHELVGYFARLRERPIRDGMRFVGVELISTRFGEHRMPSKEDPRQGTVIQPRFLSGSSPGRDLGDIERRKALADEIT